MRAWLRKYRANDGYERWERRSDLPLLGLALAFLVVLTLPMIDPRLPADVHDALDAADIAIWAGFTADYAVRLYLAPRRWRFVRTHPLDLMVVVLPVLRPLRALDLVRMLRLASVAGVASRQARRRLPGLVGVYVAGTALLLWFLAAVLMLDVERGRPQANIRSLSDSLWWAITTLSTVGYGDRYPVTAEGRLVAVALMVAGVALLGVVTAAAAAWLVGRFSQVEEGEDEAVALLRDLSRRLDGLETTVSRLSERAPNAGAPPDRTP